jgi:hypothetical protein
MRQARLRQGQLRQDSFRHQEAENCMMQPSKIEHSNKTIRLFMWRLACGVGLISFISSASATPGVTLALQLPKEELVQFSGVLDLDSEKKGATVLYPAPNLGGFLAAVLAHGLVQNSIENGEQKKLVAKANEVLLPYQTILTAFTYQELMQATLSKINTQGEKKILPATASPATGDTLIESLPLFSMSQDQRTLILNNVMAIKSGDGTKLYQNMVRVVSPPNQAQDPAAFWSSNQGKQLKDESVRMLAASYDVALADRANPTSEKAYKTVRYSEGGSEKFERAQVIQEHCNQLLIRTLRGNLMLVPMARESQKTGEVCH